MRKLGFLFSLLMILAGEISAQNQANWWYFGNKAGLNFNTMSTATYPIPLGVANGAMNTTEGCAAISDARGNLLFYTDGIRVWDARHLVMPNGTGLMGNSSSTQSGIIVPDPANKKKFYVFTGDHGGAPNHKGLRYSVVDMTLNSGNGDVITASKNTLVFAPCAERITATKINGANGFWVVAQELGVNKYRAYRVTATGVSATPVTTAIGPTPTGTSFLGYMKANPQGDKIGVCYYSPVSSTFIMDFNTSTGVLSNLQQDATSGSMYGLEFSGDGKKMYAARYNSTSIFQYNAYATNQAAFISSKFTLTATGVSGVKAMQIGPDLRIYIAQTGNQLAVIRFPNLQGTACNLVDSGPTIPTGATVSLGLPTFVQSFFIKTNLTISNSCVKNQTVISVEDTSKVDSVKYNYADPASGIKNISWNKLDSHVFNAPGKYPVTAFAFYTDPATGKVVRDTLIDTVEVLAPPRIWLGNDTTICKADSIYIRRLDTMPSTFYWWDSTKKASHVIDTAGVYWAMAVNRCGIGRDTIRIDSMFTDTLNLGPDTFICKGDTLVLDISDTNATYSWNTGSTSPILRIDTAGNYAAEVTNVCGKRIDNIRIVVEVVPPQVTNADGEFCLTTGSLPLNIGAPPVMVTKWTNRWRSNIFGYSVFNYSYTARKPGTFFFLSSNACGAIYDTVVVSGDLPFKPDLGPDTVICDQQRMLLDPNTYGTAVSWNNGWKDSAIYVNTAGTYIVSATNSCGTFKDTIAIETFDTPELTLPNDTTICSTDTININVNGGNVDYKWSHGPTTSAVAITKAGFYSLTLSNRCGSITDQIKIDTVRPLAPYLGEDTIICSNIPLVLYPYTGRYSEILWNTGERGDSIAVTEAGNYQVRLYNLCGSYTDDIEIGTEAPPQVNLGKDTVICDKEVIILNPGLENVELEESYVLWQEKIASNFFKVKREGYYRVEASNRCGSTKDTVYVNQQPRVDAGVFPDTVVCRKHLVYNLKKLPYQIEWQDGSTKKRYTIDDEGDYSFTMTDEVGCTGTEYFSVKECSGELYAPTGFTPNNNAVNEGFRVYKTDIYDFKIIIVNRWNQVVFESDDITKEWYGTNQKNDTECPIGVYLWKVSFKEYQNDQEQVILGEVNIIR